MAGKIEISRLVAAKNESNSNGNGDMSVTKYLLKQRVIFLTGPIDPMLTDMVIAELLFLTGQNPNKEIKFVVNTIGGYVDCGLAIYDMMQSIKAPISTICIGHAASMGAILLAAGTKGKRYIMPNARVMIHQVSGGADGQASDVMIQAKQMEALKNKLDKILAKHTGKPVEEISKDTDRDHWLDAEKAVEYGIVDKIIKQGDL